MLPIFISIYVRYMYLFVTRERLLQLWCACVCCEHESYMHRHTASRCLDLVRADGSTGASGSGGVQRGCRGVEGLLRVLLGEGLGPSCG